jgi:orotate phosphoribosyltransferase
MAVIDDLIASGLSYPQALAVVTADGGNNTDGLVAAGFTYTQAVGITGLNAGTSTSNNLTVQGLWAGTQVPAIVAALAVTP